MIPEEMINSRLSSNDWTKQMAQSVLHTRKKRVRRRLQAASFVVVSVLIGGLSLWPEPPNTYALMVEDITNMSQISVFEI